jgi:hypothetical protein
VRFAAFWRLGLFRVGFRSVCLPQPVACLGLFVGWLQLDYFALLYNNDNEQGDYCRCEDNSYSWIEI